MREMLRQTWDLESLFPGGSNSDKLRAAVAALQADFLELTAQLKTFPAGDEAARRLAPLILAAENISARLEEAASFVGCLQAQDISDKKADLWEGRINELAALNEAMWTLLEGLLVRFDEPSWNEFTALPDMAPVAFALHEAREIARDKLDAEREILITDLAVDGYHAWEHLRNTVVGRMKVVVEENGERKSYSVGQADNEMDGPDRAHREAVFRAWTKSWSDEAELCALALNHIGGFRLQIYRHRGWETVLKDPLRRNRMTQGTLDAMWQAVDESKASLVRYLERKARLIGVDRLSWHDVEAPLVTGGPEPRVTYEEARDFIVKHFAGFSEDMAAFADQCFKWAWIEAEDRPGKRPGGFCTSLPISGQTRIFLTFGGVPSSVTTLAHEIGHSYHQHVMEGMPFLAQQYAMNVAETASTLAEMVVSSAALAGAQGDGRQIAMMDDKLRRAVSFLMDIHARFLFERAFYDRRGQGLLSVEELNDLMLEAQRTSFRGALGEYHPEFWASKLHFYITSPPFYNFPYTFGYLFSAGVYAEGKRRGASFAARYVDLLRDTGSMTVEELAQKHLGADLTQPDFWRSATAVALEDLPEFLRRTEGM